MRTELLPDTSAAILSPDGSTVAAASNRGFLAVFDSASGKERMRINSEEPIACLAISRNNQELAAGTAAGTVQLYDLRTGDKLAQRTLDAGPFSIINPE